MLIASLPMYDLPELRAATDAWWSGLARSFIDAGVQGVPRRLERGLPVSELWRSPKLLFSQTCGYPYRNRYRGALQLIATPCYRAPGSRGPRYASLILVAARDRASSLSELGGAAFAVNGFDSWSGWRSLCRELRALEVGVAPARERAWVSGSHRASIAAVARGQCRACAVDAVTFSLLQRHAPAELDGVRVLKRTADAPALPYVTRRDATQELVSRLRSGIRRALCEPALAPARDALAIEGAQELTDDDYALMDEHRCAPGARPT